MEERRGKYVVHIREECQIHKIGSNQRRLIDGVLQIIVIVGSVSLPVLLNISEISKLVPTLLSIFIAVSAGSLKYFKFDEWGRIHRSTYMKLNNELDDYELRTGSYKGLGGDEAFYLFRSTTASILDEHVKYVNDLHKQLSSSKKENIS